ncbi:hypothetical protein ASPZODRAFT_133929 [Penicilliopsis zonata CBS 506.65]|uniref:DRBM domain-containing protein n=1 Tax=Penicilliopsis zonata CBS 506.65 TaxID=1073090 RepID=A0A1L9SDM7_9EURO|nr:hypothetical protein ASPZODRAFT_133929 [Penicilliopsis zonata CBS 506.65]OJJ45281.1 hypothetical protein ASPZODRAFT_133929 [Penicilliopsis zonata CBS 506.65]
MHEQDQESVMTFSRIQNALTEYLKHPLLRTAQSPARGPRTTTSHSNSSNGARGLGGGVHVPSPVDSALSTMAYALSQESVLSRTHHSVLSPPPSSSAEGGGGPSPLKSRYLVLLKEKGDSDGVVPLFSEVMECETPSRWTSTASYSGVVGTATARSKKEARNLAARSVWIKLGGEPTD